jgi:predicted Zn-dependent protease
MMFFAQQPILFSLLYGGRDSFKAHYSGEFIAVDVDSGVRYQSGKGIQFSTGTCLKPGFEVAENALKIAKSCAEEAKNLVDAKRIKPGKYHCILNPKITGLLAHESFGHGMESAIGFR